MAVARLLDGADPWRLRLHLQLAREKPKLAALEELRGAMADHEVPALGYVLLEGAFWSVNEREAALAVLEEGQRRYPGDFAVVLRLAYRYELLGDVDRFVELYARARAFSPWARLDAHL